MKSRYKQMATIVTIMVVFLFITYSISAEAQSIQTGIIDGFVKDSEGTPLGGVRITITLDAIKIQKVTTITDFDGVFRIPGLPPGSYKVETIFEGYYQPGPIIITLKVGRIEHIEITLLEGLQRSGSPVIEGGPMIFLSEDSSPRTMSGDFLKFIAANRNLKHVLGIFGGITGVGDQPAIDGSDIRNNAFELDGAQITDFYSGLNIIDVNDQTISEITVLRNESNTRNRKQAGGIVNIISHGIDRPFSGSLSFNAGGDTGSADIDGRSDTGQISMKEFSLTVGGPVFSQQMWLQGSVRGSLNTHTDQVEALFPQDDSTQSIEARSTLYTSQRNRISATFIASEFDSERFLSPNLAQWKIHENMAQESFDSMTSDYDRSLRFFSFSDEIRISEIMKMRFSGSWLNFNASLLPTSGDKSQDSSIDPSERIIYEGNFNQQWYEQDQNQISLEGSLDFYLDEIAGTHNILLGIEYNQSQSKIDWGYLGSSKYLQHFHDGKLFARDFVADTNGRAGDISNEITINRFSLFGQDSWSPIPLMMISFGIRYNGPVVDNSTTETLDWDDVSPRVSVSYDFLGNGKAIVGGGFARYHESPLGVRMPADQYGIGREIWDEASQQWDHTLSTFSHAGFDGDDSSWSFRINSDTNAPYVDDYYLRLDFELIENISFGMNLSYRESYNHIEDSDIGFTEDGVFETDPDFHWIAQRTKDSAGNFYTWWQRLPDAYGNYSQIFIWDNDERLSRNYTAMQLYARSRILNGFQFMGNYTLSTTRGNLDVTSEESSGFSISQNSPALFTNSEGFLSSDHRHKLVLSGYYLAKGGLGIAALATYLSGAPYNRLLFNPDIYRYRYEIRADPRGEVYRLDNQFTVDISSDFTLNIDNHDLKFNLDVMNVFNSRAVTSRDERDIQESFAKALTRLLPRTFILGIEFIF